MKLRFVGIDPDTGQGNSPTVWVDEDTGDLVVQSYLAGQALIDGALEAGHGPDHDNTIPADEALFRIPSRMVPVLRRACECDTRSLLLSG